MRTILIRSPYKNNFLHVRVLFTLFVRKKYAKTRVSSWISSRLFSVAASKNAKLVDALLKQLHFPNDSTRSKRLKSKVTPTTDQKHPIGCDIAVLTKFDIIFL